MTDNSRGARPHRRAHEEGSGGRAEDHRPYCVGRISAAAGARSGGEGVPFEHLVPNAETVEAMKAARRGELTKVGKPDKLLGSLNAGG
jgi:hypothetical protein